MFFFLRFFVALLQEEEPPLFGFPLNVYTNRSLNLIRYFSYIIVRKLCWSSSRNMNKSLETENLHLKEALNFAKRGWEDALKLLSQSGTEGLRSEEQQLEIKSLQMELDSLHKNMLSRAQQASAHRIRILQSVNTLETRVIELGELIRCPDSESEIAEKMVEELSHGVDDADEQALEIIRKVDAKCNRLQVITDFIRASSLPYHNGESQPAAPSEKKLKKKVKAAEATPVAVSSTLTSGRDKKVASKK